LAKIKFYLDESVNVAVAAGLKRRGVYVITARDSGVLGLTDIEQLTYATKNGFVIVTHDDDFLSIASRKNHAGIVYVHQQKYSIGDLIRHLKLLWDIVNAEEMKNHIEFL
jgi:predicted nuclease of predicted toxin-antitoxin system